MDNVTEKKYLYEQMKFINEERRTLTKAYVELHKRLVLIEEGYPKISKLTKDVEYQKYMASKKDNMSGRISYSIISLKIASLLKEAGRPLSNKDIYEILTTTHTPNLTYNNLTMNILPRMNKDIAINVEKAYRGYWQYRRK